MKALLVYPRFPDTYWGFRHALSFLGKKSAFPPLGLLTVSAMMPATWERRLVDMNIQSLTSADIEWADAVFCSAMVIQKEPLLQVIDLCKASGKAVVVGGPYTSIGVDELTSADHIFVGEVETTFPQFCVDFERGEAKRIYQAAERPALSATPVPDFHLAEQDLYSNMLVQFSRGCPFQCEFCDIIEIYGRIPRTKSNEQVLAELDALYEVGWRGDIFMVDDNFIGNKRNVKKLLPKLAEWSESHGYPFSFTTEASINLADDDDLLNLMRRARFNNVFIGIETPVEASLQETKKSQNTRRDLLESIRNVQSYGIVVMAGFIVGFDNDPEDIFERQIDFIRESAIPLAMVSLLTAVPDTQLWRRLEREGRLVPAGPVGNQADCTLTFVPKMDAVKLIEGYKSIVRNIYSPVEYYKRALFCLSLLVQSESAVLGKFAFSFTEFALLLRILLVLGIRDRARIEFWRYLHRLFAGHREKFKHGIVLAVLGYHLRKLTETYYG